MCSAGSIGRVNPLPYAEGLRQGIHDIYLRLMKPLRKDTEKQGILAWEEIYIVNRYAQLHALSPVVYWDFERQPGSINPLASADLGHALREGDRHFSSYIVGTENVWDAWMKKRKPRGRSAEVASSNRSK